MAVNKVKEINNLDDFQEGVFKIERNVKSSPLQKKKWMRSDFLTQLLKAESF